MLWLLHVTHSKTRSGWSACRGHSTSGVEQLWKGNYWGFLRMCRAQGLPACSPSHGPSEHQQVLPSSLTIFLSVSGLLSHGQPGSAWDRHWETQLSCTCGWQGSRDVRGPFSAQKWGPKSYCSVPSTETNDILQHRCFEKRTIKWKLFAELSQRTRIPFQRVF